jgi:general secretion pathway protein A
VLGRPIRPRFARPLLWTSVAVPAMAAVPATWVGLGAGRGLASPLFRWPSAAAPVTATLPSPADIGRALPEPSVTTPPAPDPAVAGDGEGPALRLGDVLADRALARDKRAAFASLYARWGLAYDPRTTPACEGTRHDGMQCLFKTGTWTKLRRINLPAVMELTTPDGARHYAALTALGGQTATLVFGARGLTVPLAEIEPFWDGTFIVLWKAPPLRQLTIAPGARGKDVEWLRRRLAELDGKASPAKGQDLYDDALRERVVSFQRSRALLPDGIVGAETLTHLSTALHEPGVPVLSAAKP